jgi:hypothetical protein
MPWLPQEGQQRALLRHWQAAAARRRALVRSGDALRMRMRRLTLRCALAGWAARTQELQRGRDRLRAVTLLLRCGTQARALQAWHALARVRIPVLLPCMTLPWLHACFSQPAGAALHSRDHQRQMTSRRSHCYALLHQDLGVKRVAFQRKQRALRDALAIGDALARRRRMGLATACFGAWRMRARVCGIAAARLAQRQALTQRAAWQHWRSFSAQKVRAAALLQVQIPRSFFSVQPGLATCMRRQG